jgi:hypothetical protein
VEIITFNEGHITGVSTGGVRYTVPNDHVCSYLVCYNYTEDRRMGFDFPPVHKSGHTCFYIYIFHTSHNSHTLQLRLLFHFFTSTRNDSSKIRTWERHRHRGFIVLPPKQCSQELWGRLRCETGSLPGSSFFLSSSILLSLSLVLPVCLILFGSLWPTLECSLTTL